MRTYDASLHNLIGNHPEVICNIQHDPELGPVFFDELARDPANFALLHNGSDAAMIFHWSAPHIWQMHTLMLPSCRGAAAKREGKKLIREMFVEHGAEILWGQTPLDNRAARIFNRWIGAKSVGFGNHHVSGPVEYFRNNREDWLRDHGEAKT